MEHFKRSVKRLITRLVVIGLVVICGAIAIAQANKDRTIVNAAEGLAAPVTALNDAGQSAIIKAQSGVADLRTKAGQASDAAKKGLDALADGGFQATETRGNGFTPTQPEVPAFAANDPFANEAPPTFEEQPAYNEQHVIEDPQIAPAQSVAEPSGGSSIYRAVGTEAAGAVGQFAQGAKDLGSRFQANVGQAVENTSAPPLFQNGNVQTPAAQRPELPPKQTKVPFEGDSTSQFGAERFSSQTRQETPAQVSPPAPNFDRGAGYGNVADVQQPANVLRSNQQPSQFGRNEVRSTVTPTEQPRAVGPPPAASFRNTNTYGSSTPATNDYGATGNAATAYSGVGRPGPSEQEGPQNTGLTIHKMAPRNVRVGETATFEIKVRNNSRVPAEKVLIRDEVPVGTELVTTNPAAETGANGGVLWNVGTLRPNEDVVVRMQVTPMQEGVIGSVASVTSQVFASAQAKVTKPQLKITHRTKDKVLVGDTVRFEITIENPGTGPATDVIIEEAVPPGLAHSKGPKLEYEIGTIPPGGTRRLELTLKADKAGMVRNVIVARSPAGLRADHTVNLEVVAPLLQLKIKGPTRRYLERKATYSVAIENPGTADAQNVEITTKLPQGMKFVSTNNAGRYDPLTHSIRWTLARLPATNYGTVEFTGLPTTKGDFNITARAKADKGLSDAKEHPLVVEGLAALLFEVQDNRDPIEVGSETTYRIRVQNQGTEVANNVRFVAMVPQGMQPVSAEGPTKYRIEGNRILFEPIDRLPAKGESTYNVRVAGLQENDHRFKVEMRSDGMNGPVVEQESTRVYSDK